MVRMNQVLRLGILGVCFLSFPQPHAWGQAQKAVEAIPQPDAQHVKEEVSNLLDRYPPSLRSVLTLDPGLLENQPYLAPYPALLSFLKEHPEIARTPSFYLNDGSHSNQAPAAQILDIWQDLLSGLGIFAGFGLGIGLLVWLTRTLVDYRRWNRLAKVKTDFHSKLLDRFTASNDLLTYVQSPAGSKFLQSTPIMLDAAPRSIGAPLARILWSVQGGIVLIAGGFGFEAISGRFADPASQTLHALGVLGAKWFKATTKDRAPRGGTVRFARIS